MLTVLFTIALFVLIFGWVFYKLFELYVYTTKMDEDQKRDYRETKERERAVREDQRRRAAQAQYVRDRNAYYRHKRNWHIW